MPRILRNILAVLAGTFATMACVMAFDAVNHLIWPPPPGTDPNDMESVKRAAAAMPVQALVFMEAGWMVCAIVGSLVATLIAAPPRSVIPGLIACGMLLLGTVAALMMLPHPPWMMPVAVVGIPLVGWATARVVRNALRTRTPLAQ